MTCCCKCKTGQINFTFALDCAIYYLCLKHRENILKKIKKSKVIETVCSFRMVSLNCMDLVVEIFSYNIKYFKFIYSLIH